MYFLVSVINAYNNQVNKQQCQPSIGAMASPSTKRPFLFEALYSFKDEVVIFQFVFASRRHVKFFLLFPFMF